MLLNEKKYEKAMYCIIPTVWHSEKGKTMEIVIKSVVARSLGEEGEGDLVDRRGFLRQWSYAIWYYKDGYMSLHICPNPKSEA